jgi:hypothetical protein
MRVFLLMLAGAAISCLLAGCDTNRSGRTGAEIPAGTSNATETAEYHYPDFGYLPPPEEYQDRVFRLSQQYPQTSPVSDLPEVATRDIEEIKKNWRQYLLDVRAYCFKDNIGHADVEDDWQVAHANPQWFHMPWQHAGPNGREGIHGMTKEAPVTPKQLAQTQISEGHQTYAVAVYNTFGGFTIGQVWKNSDHPDVSKCSFPNGTVVCKLLFTDVPATEVAWLNPPLQWQGYITKSYKSPIRQKALLSLVQMDVMIKHKDAPNGWLFGTYEYNGQKTGNRGWENLVPVGLMWGNDPTVTVDASNPTPKETITNDNITECRINKDTKELPPTHLGWNYRLNGPVDNAKSSCMSCHMTAEYPQLTPNSPLFIQGGPIPSPGPGPWMEWFKNQHCDIPFDDDAQTTDFSLQMSQALANWADAHGLKASDYARKANAPRALLAKPVKKPRIIYPAQRF